MKKLLFICCLSISISKVSACSCANPKSTFISSISDFTAELEVVQIDTIESDRNTQYWSLVLTKLKVIKLFNTQEKEDFVWMYNASGTDCERGLFPSHIGQKFIITGNLIDGERYKKWIGDDLQRTFLSASTCRVMVLNVEGDFVYGEITESKKRDLMIKYRELMKTDSLKAHNYIEEVYKVKNHPERVQKILLSDFYKIMADRPKKALSE